MGDIGAYRRRLREMAIEHLGPALAERVVALARPAIRIDHEPGPAGAGRSRLGGGAMLPPGAAWPAWEGRPLSLLAVLDLAAIAPLGVVEGLPPDGFLSFFFEAREQLAWGYDPAHADGWRVIRAHAGAVETPPPPDALAFAPHPLRFASILTVPSREEPQFDDLVLEERRRFYAFEKAWRRVVGIYPEEPSRAATHQLGGWPNLVQGPLWLQSQLVANGIYAGNGLYAGGPEDYREPRALALAEGASDWRLLLEIDTDDALGWMWGDEGRLYFTIRQDDLDAGDFSRVWGQLQCG